MGTTPDFLSALRKQSASTEFGLWIKHQIPEALQLSVPFGLLESAIRLDDGGWQAQLDQNRARYCVPLQVEPPSAAEPDKDRLVPGEGRGGAQHKELQQMVRQIGHDLGFGVTIEAPCQNGGAIDVLLAGEKQTIAVEVSITTSPEHEIENLRKCLSENVDQVLCVSPDNTHRLAIQNLVLEHLPQAQQSRIKYLHPASLPEYLAQFDERESQLIRGYDVVVRTVPSDPEDVEYRRARIRQLLEGV